MKFQITIVTILLASISQGQQLINGGFEKWKISGRLISADGWSNDLDAALHHSPAPGFKDSFSLVLSTWYSYVKGHLFYGEHKNPHYDNWTQYTVPISNKPLMLAGYYKYTDVVHTSDSAGGQVLIKDSKGDTLAYSEIRLDTTVNWTAFEIPLYYKKDKRKAASIAIHFVSSVSIGGMNDDSYPNRLYLDELRLVYKKND